MEINNLKKNMKTICIYHSIDLDGWMSAAIVKHWWIKNQQSNNGKITGGIINGRDIYVDVINGDSLFFIGYNYGQHIPDLSEYDKVIMCDISFPIDVMRKLFDYKELIWIDHHKSAIEDNWAIDDETNGLRDTKFAACELTWKYFFPNETMPEIVRLLGMYDSFRHKGMDEETKVLEFQYGARSFIKNYEDAYSMLVEELTEKTDSIVNRLHLQGLSIYQYLCTEAEQSYKNGFEIIFNKSIMNKEGTCPYCGAEEIPYNNPSTKYACGTTSYDDRPMTFKQGEECRNKTYNFICINKERFNPINFGIDYHKDGYDGCACFHYDGNRQVWAFSLYNDNGKVDCSQIAKQFGGGGHKGAAGFILKDINMIKI